MFNLVSLYPTFSNSCQLKKVRMLCHGTDHRVLGTYFYAQTYCQRQTFTANDKHFNPVVDNLSSRLSAHVSSQSGARSWPQAAPHFLALIGIKWLFDLTLHHSAPKFQFREISCSTGIPIHYTSSFLGKSAAGENPSFLVPCPGWHAPHFYKICPYHSYQVVYWLNTYCSVTPRPTKPMIQLATCPDANSTTLWAFDRQH